MSGLAAAQDVLWAAKEHCAHHLFQALDAAGKDGTIKHVMSGVNPQGVYVRSFKAPTDEERLHHFLWRPTRALPARGEIAIFNRSYYEEVLVVRVHPEFLDGQWIAGRTCARTTSKLWKTRYDEINAFEAIAQPRTTRPCLKFFLNVSKQEQRKRFLERLDDPEKNWKFSVADLHERGYWDEYQQAYEDMLNATSTEIAPWYVIPADKKWFTRACVADIITRTIEKLGLKYPTVPESERADAGRREEPAGSGRRTASRAIAFAATLATAGAAYAMYSRCSGSRSQRLDSSIGCGDELANDELADRWLDSWCCWLLRVPVAATRRRDPEAEAVVAKPVDEAPYTPTPENLAAREWFQDAQFGVFIHWGIYSVLGRGEWVMNIEKMPVDEYEKLPPQFNPEKFDAAEWVATVQAGRGQVHHDHVEAPRRLRHVGLEGQRLGHRRPHAVQAATCSSNSPTSARSRASSCSSTTRSSTGITPTTTRAA